MFQQHVDKLLRLSERAKKNSKLIVVWPEAAMTVYLNETGDGYDCLVAEYQPDMIVKAEAKQQKEAKKAEEEAAAAANAAAKGRGRGGRRSLLRRGRFRAPRRRGREVVAVLVLVSRSLR
mgnify:CR=1 FL=1